MGSIFGGPPQAPAPEKPISPITNRATEEGTIRRRRRRSLATADSSNRSLLNDDVDPGGLGI